MVCPVLMCHQRSGSTWKERPAKNTIPTSAVPSIVGNENAHLSASSARELVPAAPVAGVATASVSTDTAMFASFILASKFSRLRVDPWNSRAIRLQFAPNSPLCPAPIPVARHFGDLPEVRLDSPAARLRLLHQPHWNETRSATGDRPAARRSHPGPPVRDSAPIAQAGTNFLRLPRSTRWIPRRRSRSPTRSARVHRYHPS